MTEIHKYHMKTGVKSRLEFKVAKCDRLQIDTNDELRICGEHQI